MSARGAGLDCGSSPVTVADLLVGDIAGLARQLLLRAGLDGSEIDRVEARYPGLDALDTDHEGINAGDPPNAWTLACSAARHLWRRAEASSSGRHPHEVRLVLSCQLDDPDEKVVGLVRGYVQLLWEPGVGQRPVPRAGRL